MELARGEAKDLVKTAEVENVVKSFIVNSCNVSSIDGVHKINRNVRVEPKLFRCRHCSTRADDHRVCILEKI